MRVFVAVTALAILLGSGGIQAESAPAISDGFVETAEAPPDIWNYSLYHGTFTTTTLGETLSAYTNYKPSYLTVLTVNRPLPYRLWRANLEGEGQIGRHTGIMKHLEFNGVVLARFEQPFRGTPFSFAIGEGLSFATRNPELENPRRSIEDPYVAEETSRNLLNYLVFELEMAVPVDAYSPRAFIRVHHRSGIYGIFCPPVCGSNVVAYGVRFSY